MFSISENFDYVFEDFHGLFFCLLIATRCVGDEVVINLDANYLHNLIPANFINLSAKGRWVMDCV